MCPLPPPLPSQQSDGFPLEFCSERTSNRIANTQPKLRTNPLKIANKQSYEQTGASENMTGRRFHRTTEAISCHPWKAKAPLLPDLLKREGCARGCARGTAQYFFHSFPSCGPPVVQSYRSPISDPESKKPLASVQEEVLSGAEDSWETFSLWVHRTFPDLPFLAFLGNGKENHQKSKDFLPWANP